MEREFIGDCGKRKGQLELTFSKEGLWGLIELEREDLSFVVLVVVLSMRITLFISLHLQSYMNIDNLTTCGDL